MAEQELLHLLTRDHEAPIADVRAETLLRCFVIPGQQVEEFLLAHPTVMLRLLQAEARRLRDTSRWN